MSRRLVTTALAVAMSVLAAGCTAVAPAGENLIRVAPPDAPNVVVIMTDDQTLTDLEMMPRTLELIGGMGTTFTQAIVSYPLCCPSRATFLTGQHAHSHGVLGNEPPFGGHSRLDHTNTMAVWLRNGGYRTAMVGKYLNGYGRDDTTEVPPGWTEWYATVGQSSYQMYDYRVNDDGRLQRFGSAAEDYQTDVLVREAVASIGRAATDERPFFLWFTPLAPHNEQQEGAREDDPNAPTSVGSPRPAPRHTGSFADLPLPAWPSFNEADVSDKAEIATVRPLTPEVIERTTNDYRARLESLLAVDEGVDRIVTALERTGELDNTLVVFTSDNGFLLGRHRRIGKILPYEESIRVPLLVRGPGFAAGATSSLPTSNVDLAATVLRATGVAAERPAEGVALQELLAGRDNYADRAMLIEAREINRMGIPPYTGVRTAKYTFVLWDDGAVELYDNLADPDQLSSVHADPAYAEVLERLRELNRRLATCEGADCVASFESRDLIGAGTRVPK